MKLLLSACCIFSISPIFGMYQNQIERQKETVDSRSILLKQDNDLIISFFQRRVIKDGNCTRYNCWTATQTKTHEIFTIYLQEDNSFSYKSWYLNHDKDSWKEGKLDSKVVQEIVAKIQEAKEEQLAKAREIAKKYDRIFNKK